eukprot:scaffold27452_cov21-Tisochrysis_lutea.AAC.3
MQLNWVLKLQTAWLPVVAQTSGAWLEPAVDSIHTSLVAKHRGVPMHYLQPIKAQCVFSMLVGLGMLTLTWVTDQIRQRTGHLPGVAIAVMGCIVNGPGEMADADFGYVGGAPGKIDFASSCSFHGFVTGRLLLCGACKGCISNNMGVLKPKYVQCKESIQLLTQLLQ